MKRIHLIVMFLVAISMVRGADEKYTRKEDVIYGRLPGVALTMDVFTPKAHANGYGVITVVSGGWLSNHEMLSSPFFKPFVDVFTNRGYTVFAVVHGSQPKYTIVEILPQISRAVRFIRFHAHEYGVDPDHLGITGGSAGGHLSLMQGCAPVAPDMKSGDPVDHVAANVQAVGCFFPPTDFLNWGRPEHDALGRNEFTWIHAPFDFKEFDTKANAYKEVSEKHLLEIGRDISPIYHISANTPPILIIHGDKDGLVPIQQSQIMIAALEKAGVKCKLVTKPGLNHGWMGIDKDMQTVADWFDVYLRGQQPSETATRPSSGPASPRS